jgi:hypothetical protein
VKHLALGIPAAFMVGLMLLAGVVIFPGRAITTRQGNLESPTIWSHRGRIHVSHCTSGVLPLHSCSGEGAVNFAFRAEMENNRLIFHGKFSSALSNLKVTPFIVCRVERPVDIDCPEERKTNPSADDEASVEFVFMAAHEDIAFLNLIFDIESDGMGKLTGHPAYDGHIFLGTTWRWICRPDRPVPTCEFTESRFG